MRFRRTHRFASTIGSNNESQRFVKLYDSLIVGAEAPDALDEHLIYGTHPGRPRLQPLLRHCAFLFRLN